MQHFPEEIQSRPKTMKTFGLISLNISVFQFSYPSTKNPSISEKSQIEKPCLRRICSFKPATAYILHTRDMLGQGISL